MNEYTYNEIWINMEESFRVNITEDMLNKFREISGDENILHIDNSYAIEHGFSGKVVYGMLTASFISRLVGMYLPGKYCLFQKIEELKFIGPVYVGDQLEIVGRVEKKNDTAKRLYIKVYIKKQDEVVVCKANVVVGCLA